MLSPGDPGIRRAVVGKGWVVCDRFLHEVFVISKIERFGVWADRPEPTLINTHCSGSVSRFAEVTSTASAVSMNLVKPVTRFTSLRHPCHPHEWGC
jgi:hypothetical protein